METAFRFQDIRVEQTRRRIRAWRSETKTVRLVGSDLEREINFVETSAASDMNFPAAMGIPSRSTCKRSTSAEGFCS